MRARRLASRRSGVLVGSWVVGPRVRFRGNALLAAYGFD